MRAMSIVRTAVLAAALMAMTLAAHPASARSVPLQPDAASLSDADSSLPRTLIYASVASLFDITVGYIVDGGFATGTAIAFFDTTSGWLLYYVHEKIWAAEVPLDPAPAGMVVDKTATFTAANSIRLLGIGLLAAQNPVVAAGALAFNVISDTAAYIVTDRVWALFSARKLAAAIAP